MTSGASDVIIKVPKQKERTVQQCLTIKNGTKTNIPAPAIMDPHARRPLRNSGTATPARPRRMKDGRIPGIEVRMARPTGMALAGLAGS